MEHAYLPMRRFRIPARGTTEKRGRPTTGGDPGRIPVVPAGESPSRWRTVLIVAIASALVPSGRMQAQTAVDSTAALKGMSLEELMNLEVTSVSRQAEKLLDAASAIQVVTSDDIRRSTATRLPEALRLAGNLHVAQRDAHSWAISARGFNTELANKLLVLMDGRTVYTPLFSGVFWDRQDYLLEDIDRIEVISGPGGALWGANAVNGVINIMSKSAQDTQGLYVEAGGGSTMRALSAARFGGTLAPNVYFRVYGKYFDRDGEAFADGSEAPDGWHSSQAGFRVDSDVSVQDHLTIQGDLYRGRENLVTGGVSRTRGGNLSSRWTRTFSNDSDLSLKVYYDRTHLVLPTAPFVVNGIEFAPAGTFVDDLDTYDLDFQHRFRWDSRQRVVWGLGYRRTHDATQNAPALAFLPPVLDQDLASGFVQDEISLRDDVFLTAGIKLEHNDYSGWESEPSLRLTWNVDDRQTAWAAVSRAIRAPSRVDRDIAQAAPPYLVLLAGGDNFVSETVIAFEAGYRAQPTPQLAWSASAFFNRYDDLRSTSLTPTTILPFFFENNLAGKTYGFELAADYRVTERWQWQAGYNFLAEDIHVRDGAFDFNNALNETADPRHQVTLRTSVDLPAGISVDLAGRWVDSLRVNSAGTPATVPGYGELDARLTWHATDEVELSLVGQNLLHDRHPEYGVPSPTRVEIGRRIWGKLACRF